MNETVERPVAEDWRAGFHAAIATWLNRVLPERRPDLAGKQVVTVLSVEEEWDRGFGGSDVTAGDDPEVNLTIYWLDQDGQRQFYFAPMLLTDLMKELT